MARFFVFLAAAGLAAGPAVSQNVELPATSAADPAAERIDYVPDPSHRMTVSVEINGEGPFPFIVDTGAERTVISRELAERLQLDPAGDVVLATMSEVRQVPSVSIERLDLGRRTLTDIQAPMLDRHNMGAEGMLGVDSLQSQRIVFDFGEREMRIARSRVQEEKWPEGTIVVTGRSRLGRLVVTRAWIEGERITVIIDTGSQMTVANQALRDRLARRNRLRDTGQMELIGVTGSPFLLEYATARRIRVGEMNITNLRIAFADLHIFEQLELDDRPAVLLGMDALRLFDKVMIDFASKKVLLLPQQSSVATPVRLASLADR